MKTKTNTPILIKTIKWIAISVAGITVSFIIFALIVGFFYQEKVKNIIIDELNKSLLTEIKVEKIELSLIKKFPFASLTLFDLTAKDATEKKHKDTLLFAEKIFLKFNIIDIFRENYKIKAIDIEHAKLNLKVYNDNSSNYKFWKESTDSSESTFNLELKKISCTDVKVNYIHAPLKQIYDFNINKGVIRGKFHDEIFNASADADVFVNKILIDDIPFLNGKKTNLALSILVNNETSSYDISDGRFCVGNMCFDIAGNVIDNPKKTNLNISIQGKDIDLPTLIEELPENYKTKFNDYKSSGSIQFKCVINGALGDEELPHISLTFDMKDGNLNHKKNNLTLSNISFNAQFNNGEKQTLSTYKLYFENFKAKLAQGVVSGNFSIEDFNYPLLKIEAKANFNLDELAKFLNLDFFDEIKGELDLDFLFYSKINDLSEFSTEDFINSKCHGKAQIKNASLILKETKKSFKNINGKFQFNNNDIIIDYLEAFTEISDFKIVGYFRNALSFFFIPSQKISIEAGLMSDNLFLDELLLSSISKNDTIYKLKFSEFIDYNLDVDVKNMQFGKFEAHNIKGKIKLKNKILKAENIIFDAFDGSLKASATIDGRQENILLFQCETKLQKTDITKMFYQLENFGQKELIDKNIKGKLSTEINFIAQSDASLNIDLKNIYSFADVVIENGELIDFAPIKELSRFIKVNDLSHIKFETLKNRIEIKDQTIFIPNMTIRSDAVNIEALGTHTFDNKIDYRLRILLSELLGKKAKQAKKENEEFGVVEEDNLGRTTLFLKITGTVDKPIVSYDTKGVYDKNKNAIKEDFKKTIKKIENELFKKNDTISGLETEKQKEKKKKRKENEILEDFKIE